MTKCIFQPSLNPYATLAVASSIGQNYASHHSKEQPAMRVALMASMVAAAPQISLTRSELRQTYHQQSGLSIVHAKHSHG